MPLEIVRNDITRMRVDAIVNAANPSLLGGGGVDGAIHLAAGPGLLEECRKLGGCRTGEAKITAGYDLPCRYVIHTVGPVWQGGNNGERGQLTSCYRASLALAEQHGCETVAFPLISAGTYGYPRAEALEAAVGTIREFLQDHAMTVFLVNYERASFTIGEQLYSHIRAFIDDRYIDPLYEEREMKRRAYNAPAAMPDAAAIREAARVRERPEPSRKPGLFERRRQKKAETVDNASILEEAAAPAAGFAPSGLRDYLSQLDEGFRDMLLREIDARGMTDAECYKRANVDRKLFNKIKNQPEYRPGKSTVLAFAVALRMSMAETGVLLRKAGYSLSHSSKADLIVEYFILHGRYDIFEINEALFAFDQKLLGSN